MLFTQNKMNTGQLTTAKAMQVLPSSQSIEKQAVVPAEPNNKNPSKQQSSWFDKAQYLAEVVCSRESTYRAALDLIAYEIPAIVAESTRNIYKAAEAVFEAVMATCMIYFAPKITKVVADNLAKLTFDKEELKDAHNFLLFSMNDLDSVESANKAKKRILNEETNDLNFLAKLFKGQKQKAEFNREAAEIKTFAQNFNADESKLNKIKQHKRAVILGESLVEGGLWAALPLMIKAFRRYVLGQEGFTGTLNYLNKKQSKKIGVSSGYSLIQKIGMGVGLLISPLLNMFLLNKTKDPSKIQKGSWLETIRNQLDMTHRYFPKLGLLFSYINLPSLVNELLSAQGRFELFEVIAAWLSVVPSWWFGHRATNGVLAKQADKYLAQKYNVEPGILVEASDLNQAMPEPAKIQHIFDRTKDNPDLRKEARELHAKVLYKGFGLHAVFIFGIKMLVNYLTKTLVKSDLKSTG